MSNQTRNGVARLLAASLGIMLLGLAAAPAIVSGPIADWIMVGFATVCHQLPDRSPHVDGHQLAACHRCFGIYAGLLLGSLLTPLGRDILQEWRAFVVPGIALAVAPAGIDWLGGLLGWWHSGPFLRALTGSVFGFIGGAFILIAIRDLMKPDTVAGPASYGS